VGVCDIEDSRRDAAAARFGVEALADANELVEKLRPDVVTIATPDHLHVEPALAAIRAGCHVFCEKPLATSTLDARRLVEAAADRGVQLAVDFNRRFAFGYARAKHALTHGILGRLRYAVLRVADRVPPPEVARTPHVMFTTLLTHHLDLMRWYGGEVHSVHVTTSEETGAPLVKTVTLTLRFAAGGLGTIVAGYRDNLTRTVEWMELAGEHGSVVVDDITRRVEIATGNPDCARILEPSPFRAGGAFNDSISEHVKTFLAHLARQDVVPVTGRDGVASLVLAEAAIESLTTGHTIEIASR
jgi:predicted dehydrogenase